MIGAVAAVFAAAGVAAAVDRVTTNSVPSPVSGAQRAGVSQRVDRFVPDGPAGADRQVVRFVGASYVKVHLGRVVLHPGDAVVVADPSGTESYRYRDPAAGVWATSISGDTAVVSVEHAPRDRSGLLDTVVGPGVWVDTVTRGLTAEEAATLRPRRTESVCGGSDDSRDAVCYRSTQPAAYARSKAVTRLLIDGVEMCTAWRVGPNNRMLTNNHCLASAEQVRATEVWFDFQCAQCGGHAPRRPVKVRGADLLATDQLLDFTLFTVDDVDAVRPFGFLDLDVRQPQQGEEVYIPQHPRGAPTVIAMSDPQEAGGNCAVDNPRYDGYAPGSDVSYFCDTDGGSSGSPVISRRTDKVVALHHFGGCPNSGVRIDLIAARISGLL